MLIVFVVAMREVHYLDAGRTIAYGISAESRQFAMKRKAPSQAVGFR